MPHEAPAPRRHRSNFRAPDPESVDTHALTRVFGTHDVAAPAPATPAAAPAVAPETPTEAALGAGSAPKHRADPVGNRRTGEVPTIADADRSRRPAGATEAFAGPAAPVVRRSQPATPAESSDAAATTRPAPSAPPTPLAGGDGPAAFPWRIVPEAPEPGSPARRSGTARASARVVRRAPSAGPARRGAAAITSARRSAATPTRPAPASAAPVAAAPATPAAPLARTTATASAPAPTSRPRGSRRAMVVGSAAALAVLTALGAVAIANDVPASLFAGPTASEAGSDEVTGASAPLITSDLSETAAPFTGGTSITVTGERLDEVALVSVAGAPATIVEASAERLTFTVPATTGDAVGDAPVVFADAQGRAVQVSVSTGGSAAASDEESASPATPSASSEASAAADGATDSLTLTYTTDPGIDAQLAYVLAYWSDYNTDEYPAVPGKDAVSFASQSLVARGWAMDDVWNVDPATGAMSATWTSSTALRDYLRTRSDRATELTDAERDQVKVGDLAQFDWDDSGDRDHTAVVTRVERAEGGTKVWVASHTKDADYWDVDAALASGGGSVTWFSIR